MLMVGTEQGKACAWLQSIHKGIPSLVYNM